MLTFCMNFLQIGRISLLSVALNIMTCLECGVARKTCWTSRRMSVGGDRWRWRGERDRQGDDGERWRR